MKIYWGKLIISLFICQLAGIIGSIFTAPAVTTWYAVLNKPAFNPPDWIFAPVWIILYVLMGISFYIIWIKSSRQNFGFLFSAFVLQLILNAFWNIIFFGLRFPLLAFIEIIVLWVMILICIFYFYPVSRASSYLLVPYIIWVTFAAVLNFAFWKMN
jgi:tryptophan-rich sensory protein